MSVQGREQAEPLKTVTHLSWWREAGRPAQGDILSQRNSDVGGTWREVQTSGQMKNVLFLFETFLPWEYLRSSHGVQASPAPRRQRAWSPCQHQEPRATASWGRGSWVERVSADPPASLIGEFPYDVTALCLCRLPLSTGPLGRTQGWLLYALPCPAQPLSKGWV